MERTLARQSVYRLLSKADSGVLTADADNLVLFPEIERDAADRTRSSHPVVVYVSRLAVGSRPTMAAALKQAAHRLTGGRRTVLQLDWSALTYAEVQALRSQLADHYAPATANKILAAVRGVCRECWRLGKMDADTYQRIADVEAVRGHALPAGRALAVGEIRALFAVCRSDRFPAAGTRDAAMLGLMYGAGLRRSEVVALDLAHFDADSGALTIRHGKGRKDRILYVTNGARLALDAWLMHRGLEPGPLFVRVTQGGHVRPRRLSDDAAWNLCVKRARQAQVKAFGPHSLRRTFVTHLLEAGADVGTVQQLAGHANVQTTLRYDRRGEKAKRQAVELLHVPFAA